MNIDRPAKRTREIVRDIMQKHPDWRAPQVWEEIGTEKLTLNAVQKHMENLKPIFKEIQESGTENIWNLGSYHSLPADSIPYILKVQALDRFKVTVRQAKWISVLYKTVTDIDLLANISWHYAFKEVAGIISKHPFDSSEYDKYLVNPKKQKELVKLFETSQNKMDWSLLKESFTKTTGYKLHEQCYVVQIKDGIARGIRKNDLILNLGTADKILEQLKAHKAIKEMRTTQDGVTHLLLKEPLVVENEEKYEVKGNERFIS